MDEKQQVVSEKPFSAPMISLPKGAGAIRGIGEKFAANPVTGTGSITVPIATSPGRSGFGPQLSLSYDSGSGNGPFGFGWSLSLPSITRKTERGLPKYQDAAESDVFILSGSEDLVPALKQDEQGKWVKDEFDRDGYKVKRYRPRIEGLFARIERWTSVQTGKIHWRSVSKDNITTFYGKTNDSCIFDPDDPDPEYPPHIFSWLICASYDDKGNAIVYKYTEENDDNVDRAQVNERNRIRTANRYLKRVKYGNRTPNRDLNTWQAMNPSELSDDNWMFEVVFDYEEGHYEEIPLDPDRPETEQHQFVQASTRGSQSWAIRADPFSSYRAGFEVRTYRLCQRVLMFHHFPDEDDVRNDCLVRSTDFTYSHELDPASARSPIYTFLRAVTQSGYRRTGEGYLKRSLPPLEFEYSTPVVRDIVEEVDPASLENLPIGVDGTTFQWTDLHGEGIPGILAEQADAWFYKRNLSPICEETVQFAPLEQVDVKPNLALAAGAQFMDLAGDGQPDLVAFEDPMPGLYEHDGEEGWQPFRPFLSPLNRDIRDPNLKFVDLNGDGHADVLITEDDAFVWHASLAEAGFGPAQRVHQVLDEERGLRLVFADGTQSIYLADLSGDGLTDLVRIRNGEVCYWPNLGYGRFGAKVIMDHAPRFDQYDQFDQKRIRLADIDGSGTTDIIYLHRDGVRLYFNQSGNSWSEPQILSVFPRVDDMVNIVPTDLLGNGTACLVWSSSLPGDAARPMRYINLMGGQKPHLMVKTANNLGAETRVRYAPSTKFYLQDRRDGKPWITRLPFPVHVVERVETYDYISRNLFVTRYAYHHGYFDGEEREFRGFGMVEQWDTEEIGTLAQASTLVPDTNWDAASFVLPILTRTWFHTGAFLDGQRISKQFEHEYWLEGDLSDDQLRALLLEDTVLPVTIHRADGARIDHRLTTDEMRQACRSLKGATLRQEIYGVDGTDAAGRPYSVSEQNYTIELLQPQDVNQYAVFFTHACEQIDYHYERRLVDVQGAKCADPRVSHVMTLEVDAFGNALRSLAIGYRRRDLPGVDAPEQKETHMALTVNRVTNEPDEPYWYRIGLPVETRMYEIVKPPEPAINNSFVELFKFDDMVTITTRLFPADRDEPDISKVWPYKKWDWRNNSANAPYETRLRLIEHIRTLYRKDNLDGFLSLGDVDSLALPGKSYKLAFTPDLLAAVYDGRVTDSILAEEGGYIHSEGDVNWWIPSGEIFYSPDTTDLPAEELSYARAHFFLSHRYRDPFHTDLQSTEIFVRFDNNNLLVQETRDALENSVRADNNYRVLQPHRITDPNGNRTEAAFDALGMVVATAVRGKETENLGDNLNGFESDLTQAQTDDFHDAQDPHVLAPALLRDASTRIIYDLHRFYHSRQAHPTDSNGWEPPYTATLARETHASDGVTLEDLKIQISFSYSDGFEREIQKKVQAEPGEVEVEDANGNVSIVDTTPDLRWVGSGWTIFNNKGKPIRQYEPFFSIHHHFQFAKKVGVSPILFYDPVGRAVATLHPNHTWEKVVFDPWQQTNYDVNDTVTFDPKTDPDIGTFLARLPDSDYRPTWYQQRIDGAMGNPERTAAEKAAAHANTPTVAHFDSLGRTFLTIAHNRLPQGEEEKYATRILFDIEGNQREVIDAKGRIVMRYHYFMAGPQEDKEGSKDSTTNRIHQASMEAGERWVLNDVTGNPIRAWDSRGFMRRLTYDQLRRPKELFVKENDTERLAEETVYGESQGSAHNHRTRVYQVKDGAGIVTSERYDFKGNLLQGKRELLADYQHAVDWLQNPNPNDGKFTSSTEYDALNRPTSVTTPDNSIYRPAFNEANLLNTVEVNVRGAEKATPFVDNIDYNAKGRRTLIEYANDTQTEYEYDAQTFRLIHLQTTRPTGRNGLTSQLFANDTVIQDLYYTYDPAGNIMQIEDRALRTIFHNSQLVEPICTCTYDALYRLVEAHGREHIGQAAFDFDPREGNRRDYPFSRLYTNLNDPEAVRNYGESYEYDEVGNFKLMRHSANSDGNWTRQYFYEEDSLIEGAGKKSNRLTWTQIGDNVDSIETYSYKDSLGNDVHGCITSINMMRLSWDFKDHLHEVHLPHEATAYYVYDAAGQRVRKVICRQNGTKQRERLYLGGFEIYREYNGTESTTPKLEREALHIMDDNQRIALVETKTIDDNVLPETLPETLTRYQFGNHLGSASLELDIQGEVISYEEYYPYGSTSFQAVRSQTEAPKRYRYTGKERDEESGLYYHGVRYYAVWLGRWAGCDPAGTTDGINLYIYAKDRPIIYVDREGKQALPPELVEFLNVTQRGYAYYAAKFALQVSSPQELGKVAAIALQEHFARIFGKGTIEVAYSASGSGHIIDISLNKFKLDIELKLNPTSERWEQSLTFIDRAGQSGRRLAFVNQKNWWAANFGNRFTKVELTGLRRATTQLARQLTREAGFIRLPIPSAELVARLARGALMLGGLGYQAWVSTENVTEARRTEGNLQATKTAVGEVGGVWLGFKMAAYGAISGGESCGPWCAAGGAILGFAAGYKGMTTLTQLVPIYELPEPKWLRIEIPDPPSERIPKYNFKPKESPRTL